MKDESRSASPSSLEGGGNHLSSLIFHLSIALALALAMRIVYFVGFSAADDMYYAQHAVSMLDGTYRLGTDHHGLRFGLLVPVAACTAVFGRSIVSLVLFPLLCSLASVALAFTFGRRLGGDRAGLAAAIVLAVTPLAVGEAAKVAPETAAGCLLGAAALLHLLAHDATGRKALAIASAAGVVCGLSHLVKESAFFLIAYFAVEAAVRRRWRPLVAAIAGFAAVALIEGVAYLAATGDFFYRVRATGAAHVGSLALFVSGEDASFFAPIVMVAQKRYSLGLQAGALVAAGIAMAVRRDASAAPFLRWCGALFVLTAFWPARLSPYLRAIPVDPRYYEPLLLPSAVAIGVAVSWLRGWKLAAVLAAAAPVVLAFNAVTNHNQRLRAELAVATHAHLATRPVRPIVADPEMGLALRFLSGYRRDVVITDEPRAEWREFALVRRDAPFEPHSRDAHREWNARADGWTGFARTEAFVARGSRSTNLRTVMRLRRPASDQSAVRVMDCARK